MKSLSSDCNVFIYARGGERYGIGDPNWDLPCVTWAPQFGGIAGEDAVSMLHFWKWLCKNSIDIVIVNEQQRFEFIKKIAELGCVVGAYVDFYTEQTIPLFDIYDFLLCNTRRHYSVFNRHRKAVFIQWGTDINLFRPLAGKYTTASEQVVFFHSAGFIGKSFRKGTDLLVKAFQKVRGKVKLIIHSQLPLSEYGEIAEIIRRDERIEFIEKTVPPPGLYHLGDVFVYPSRLEGIGLCVPEALACGLAVITTNNAPMNEFVEDGVNGFLVRVAESCKRWDNYYWPETIVDLDDLTAKMQTYADVPGLVAKHSRNARKSAEEKFDWAKNSAGIANVLGELAKLKKIQRPNFIKMLQWYIGYIILLLQKYVFKLALILPKPAVRFLNRVIRNR